MNVAVDPKIKPGIYQGIPNEAYHAGPGVSKTGLWTIKKSTPAHYKFPPERKRKEHFEFGDAAHLAILEPDAFEKRVFRGPDDRRGNKWKDALEACELDKLILLTSTDYDNALAVRDAVHADQWINSIVTGGERMVEASGYWIDPETGELCRCRPDLYRADLGIILDVKSTQSAHPTDFKKSVINYGYHSQEAFYTDGWNACLNAKRAADKKVKAKDRDDVDSEINGTAPGGVQGFIFLAWEKESPHAKAVYELPPSIVDDGRAIMRKSLNTYADCRAKNYWPAYADGVQELSFPKWAYQETQAPEFEDAA